MILCGVSRRMHNDPVHWPTITWRLRDYWWHPKILREAVGNGVTWRVKYTNNAPVCGDDEDDAITCLSFSACHTCPHRVSNPLILGVGELVCILDARASADNLI